MRKLLAILALALSLAAPARAQISVPFTFTPGTTILASEVNANFAVFAQNALNRNGGTITGNISVDPGITIDGVDISAFLQATGEVRSTAAGSAGAPAFAGPDPDTGMYFPGAGGVVALSLNGTQRFVLNSDGLTIFGTNIVNSSGKIPALTSTYFSSLDGSALTNIPESAIVDGTILARVAANETITGAWTFNPGTLSSDVVPISITPTWNNAGVNFTALDINVTNTASGADSKLFDARVGGSSVFSVDKSGKVTTTAFQMTTGATNGHVLTSDASGNASWQALPPGTTGVPSGMVAMFEGSCPSGWTMRSGVGGPYENRFVRGAATFGTTGGADTHTHTIDPGNTSTTTDGAHTHSVDPGNANTSSAGSHSHSPSTPTTETSSAGSHSHSVDIGSVNSGGPSSTTGVFSGGFSFATDTHTHSFDPPPTNSSTDGSHTHIVTWPSTASAGAHTHSINLPSTGTTSAGSHNHSVDIAAFSSGSGTNIPAYIQVVFCKKN